MEIKFKKIIYFIFFSSFLVINKQSNGQILKFKDKQIHSFSLSNLITAKLNNRWGIVDDSNHVYIPFEYDSIKYEGISYFKTYKNGKVGLVTQYDNSNEFVINKVREINASFDSIQIKQLFVKTYSSELVYVYWFDGSLLFHSISLNTKVCSIKLKCNSDCKNEYSAYKIFDKVKSKFIKDPFNDPTWHDPFIFFKNKYYRINPQKTQDSSTPTTVTEIKFSKYFKKQIRKDKKNCCVE